MANDKELSLIEHLEELRSRIIKSIILVAALSILAYLRVNDILRILIKPVGRLIFTAPQEALMVSMKISFFVGLFLASPFVLYQIWRFISVGLKIHERKYALILGIFSFILFAAGFAFGYFVVVPIALRVFLSYSSDMLIPMISIGKYVSFVGIFSLMFGLVFQLPLVILFLARIGIVRPRSLSAKRGEAIVVIFILAGVLTPPDVVSQILMAVPLLILYEVSIILAKIFYKKKVY